MIVMKKEMEYIYYLGYRSYLSILWNCGKTKL